MDKQVKRIRIQVCFAKSGQYLLRELQASEGMTIGEVLLQSGILQEWSEIDLAVNRVGIWGKLKTLDAVLRDQDRIEIYLPLIADPKESRRQRVGKKLLSESVRKTGKPV